MTYILLCIVFCFFFRRENNTTTLSDLHHTGGTANETDDSEPKTVSDLYALFRFLLLLFSPDFYLEAHINIEFKLENLLLLFMHSYHFQPF